MFLLLFLMFGLLDSSEKDMILKFLFWSATFFGAFEPFTC